LCELLMQHLARHDITLRLAGTPTRGEHATVQSFSLLPLRADF
jgi:hypothetical protein